jgi:uncharacterized protein (TIGR02145 family)/uncharacterized repeat protein (TIGR02543 family)
MKKTILYATFLTALVCLCCNDGGVQNKNPDVDGFMKLFSRENSPDNAYTLTTNASPQDGGTVSRNPDKASYKFGEPVTVTANPANGHIFAGWSGAATGTANPVVVTMDGNKALTAGFGLPGATRFTVYFNGNGTTGGSAPTPVSADSGSSIKLPEQSAMERTGYSFGGWNTKNDGTGTNYAANTSYVVKGNVTLYATWNAQTFSLTANISTTGGGTVSRKPNRDTYQYGEQVTVTATPAAGYTFTGWSGASDSKDASITITMNGNKTLTAGFGKQGATRFTVYFNSNGGGSAPASVSADSGSAVTLPDQQTMLKTGYNFEGWNTKSDGTGTDYAANFSYTVTGNVTLYAKWTAYPKYTVTYNGNNNTGGSVPAAATADSASTLTLSGQGTLTRTGYSFTGWNTNGAGTGTDYAAGASYTVKGNVTLYAKWTAYPKYTITYNGNSNTGGSVPTATTADSGSSVTLSNQGTMARTGYNFDGWNTSSAGTGTNYAAGASYTVTGNVTLYAKWTAATYSLTTNLSVANSGTVSRSPNKEAYQYGEEVTVTATAASGYTFTGWSGASDSKEASIKVTMDGNKTLTAGFGKQGATKFTISFNNNGSTGGSAPAAVTADSGSSITLSSQGTLARTLYNFSGWNTSSAGTGTDYAAGASYTVTGNITLYAKWTAYPKYTVTYNGNSNTSGSAPATTTTDSGSTVTLSGAGTMARTLHNFSGWNTSSAGTGTNYAAGASYTVTGNVTLYAKWTAYPKYTVTYDGNSNSSGSAPAAATVDSGSSVTLPAQGTLARSKHNFGGWNTSSAGTGTNYAAEASYKVTGNVTLYAKWTAYPTYKVTYSGNSNSSGSAPTAATADSGSAVTLSDQGTLVRTGYNFSGWNTSSNGTGTDYAVGTSYTVTGNVTLYAKWTIKKYTVTYNGNGTTTGVPSANSDIDSGSSVTLPGVGSMARTGYNFGGWNTSSDGTGTNYTTSYKVTGNVTLYAKWVAYPTYKVTYSGNSNTSGGAPDAVSVDSGTVITLSGQGTLARTGYEFGGWNTNTGGTGTDYSVGASYTVKSNITLYAKWTVMYTLSTTVIPSGGGTVSRNLDYEFYTKGTSVIVTATATSGYEFIGWSGASTSTSANVTITMDGNKTLTANFMVSPSSVVSGTFTDTRNNKTYNTIKIGTQLWMAENLNYAITNTTTDSSWCYSNNTDNCAKYGRLYNWSAAMGGSSSSTATPSGLQGVCPASWHLPSRAEWVELAKAVGGTGDYGNGGTAGTKLKSSGGWNAYSGIPFGTDDFGFSALPGGYRSTGGSFSGAGDYGYWWTATESGSSNAYYRYMNYNDEYVSEKAHYKSYGFSVRCLGD